jgi:hypothetical protein
MSNVEFVIEIMDEDGFDPAVLGSYEAWWRDQQVWLKERGYILRPRYRADWVPSWKGNKKVWTRCEDSKVFPVSIFPLKNGVCFLIC